MSKEKKTKCECPLAGFCKRHNMVKGPHLHKLCQTREDYFQLWEEGFGPGQGSPQNTAAKEEEVLRSSRSSSVQDCYVFRIAVLSDC